MIGVILAAVMQVPIPQAGTSGKAWVALEGGTAAACHWKVGAVRAAKEPTCSAAAGWTATQKRETLAAAGTADPIGSLNAVTKRHQVAPATDARFAPAYVAARNAALANRPADPVWTVRKYGTGTRTAATPIRIEMAADGIEDVTMIEGAATVPALAPCDCKRIMFAGGVCYVPGQPVAVVAQCVRR
jgi:hypothetical protein